VEYNPTNLAFMTSNRNNIMQVYYTKNVISFYIRNYPCQFWGV